MKKNEAIVQQVYPIVLAAGRAARMGATKILADLSDKPLIAHVLESIQRAGLPPAVIVLGHEATAVRRALRQLTGRIIIAERHEDGISQSLRAGVAALPDDAVAALICLADMPAVSHRTMRDMAEMAHADCVVVPRFEGRRGNPVLWGRNHFHRLACLEGDLGAKVLLNKLASQIEYLDCADEGVLFDIDTSEELLRMREIFAQLHKPG